MQTTSLPDRRSIIVVIPAFNEGSVIASVIDSVKLQGITDILVVDDGSSDDTAQAATKAGAFVVRHKLNRGKGAATKTGIEVAKQRKAEIVVTMDGDGQHEARDILPLIKPIMTGEAEVVLGTRVKNRQTMPFHKKIANYIANLLTWLAYGLWVTDSQSGLRAFSYRATTIINTNSDKYEYDSEVIREIRRHHIPFVEVPIHVRYTHYSLTKPQRQDFINGIKTMSKIFWHKIT